jgi:hypothetical protein
MPHNAKGDHYANPAYGKMMEGGKSKGKMSMEAYGEKAEAYSKAGYMVNKIEVEYAENGFVVKCHWEYPKGDMKKMKDGEMGMASMGYMEPTVKVFENSKDMAYFVGHVFNEYRHGGVSYPGENGTKPKAPLINKSKGVNKGGSHNPGSHKY